MRNRLLKFRSLVFLSSIAYVLSAAPIAVAPAECWRENYDSVLALLWRGSHQDDEGIHCRI